MELNCDSNSDQNINFIFKDINDMKIETFLSPYVKEIVTQLSFSDIELKDILSNELCLNWDEVIKYLPKDINISYINNEWTQQMSQNVSTISPLINSVYKVFDNILNENINEFIDLFEKNLFWTQKLSKNFIESFKLLKENRDERDVNNILSLQLIVSSLEQCLGNIVLTRVGFVPPLIKDLLRLPELALIVGNNTIALLQLTIGSPFTLNLRNILWHGFVSHEDIDQRFAYFLFCICLTIGHDLDHKFREQVLPQRPLTIFSQQLIAWNSMFPQLDYNDLSLISRIVFENCPFISKRMLSLWKYAFHLYNNNSFGFCIAIIFPQFECCLRFIYSIVNQMTSRIMTAIAREYYTTFAEILSQTLPDSEQQNKIHEIFDQSFIELLLDLIIIPEGPRIRDKLSHGQINIFAVEKYVANHVICVAVCALVSAEIKLNNKMYDKYISVDIISEIMKTASNYKCLFHPKSQLRSKIIDFAESLSDLKKFSIDETICDSNSISPNIENLSVILNNLVFSQTVNFIDTEQEIINKLKNYNLNILSDPKNESNIIVLRQIVDNVLQSSKNIKLFLELRRKQYFNLKLRSRQRLNYKLMLKNLELYRKAFSIILSALYLLFINNFERNEVKDEIKLMKSLRYILSLSENMSSNSNLTANKWDKFELLIKNLCNFLFESFLNNI